MDGRAERGIRDRLGATPWAAYVRNVMARRAGLAPRPRLILAAVAPRPRDHTITGELASWAAEIAGGRHGRN